MAYNMTAEEFLAMGWVPPTQEEANATTAQTLPPEATALIPETPKPPTKIYALYAVAGLGIGALLTYLASRWLK